MLAGNRSDISPDGHSQRSTYLRGLQFVRVGTARGGRGFATGRPNIAAWVSPSSPLLTMEDGFGRSHSLLYFSTPAEFAANLEKDRTVALRCALLSQPR